MSASEQTRGDSVGLIRRSELYGNSSDSTDVKVSVCQYRLQQDAVEHKPYGAKCTQPACALLLFQAANHCTHVIGGLLL